jgi:K+-transporting ATPase ATPase A chain
MVWFWPVVVTGLGVALSIPLGLLIARLLDRKGAVGVERFFDTGVQTWPVYAFSMLLFNILLFVIGYILLASQQYYPKWLNPDDKPGLAASTIFNTAVSFVTNTNLQHYSGEQHLAYGSQLLVILWKQMVTPAIGLAVLLAMIRALRGEKTVGNFYLDTARSFFYVMLPLSIIVAALLLMGGVPMTMEGAATATIVDQSGAEPGKELTQTIARGPVAAIVSIKQLGTNGGGFFGANSCHPFENPNAFTNLIECLSIILIPFALVVTFGKMMGNFRHAAVIYGVMLLMFVTLTALAVSADSLAPNPAFTDHPATPYSSALVGLPVDQDGTGNLEGKELRFGPGAGPTWAAMTTCIANGSVNCMHDSLNPLAGLAPLTAMWLNCFFGGKGVGMINLLVYLIVGVFLAGLMVGRTPEYFGKKVEAREMKLAMLALLVCPICILMPTGLVVSTEWGKNTLPNPAAHGLSQALYEFSSAAANNGSGFEGLGDTVGFAEVQVPEGTPPDKAAEMREAAREPRAWAFLWDLSTGLVMLLCRYVPIIAPLALAGSLSMKRPTPFTAGTMRTDTITFAIVLLGTILLVGALLFLPVAALGPIAEHLGPIPYK